jgi:hypothetical protein
MKRHSVVKTVIALPILAIGGFYIYLSYFWKPNFLPIQMIVGTGVRILKPLSSISIIVTYDENGRMALTGTFAKEGQKYDNIGELRSALIALHGKGSALLIRTDSTPEKSNGQGGIKGLFAFAGAPVPAENFELESEICDALRAAGFTPLNEPAVYNLHRLPDPPH